MIEAFELPAPTAGLIRHRRSLVHEDAAIVATASSSLAQDLRFFATAYAGALIFFLAWLA